MKDHLRRWGAFGPFIALLGFSACGRIGFDAWDSGNDAAPPPAPRIVLVNGSLQVNDLAFDPDGNLAFSGEYAGTITLGGQTASTTASRDMFLAVTDPVGSPIRLWTGGATQFGTAQNISWLADGSIAMTGFFAGQLTRGGGLDSSSRQAALMTRFAPDGTLVLAKHYTGSGNVQARGSDAIGDRLTIVGSYIGATDFGQGPLTATAFDNGFIVTMGLSGDQVVGRSLNGNPEVTVSDVAFGEDGDVYVGGRLNATTDFGAGPVSGGTSLFVARYSPTLALRWVRAFGSAAKTSNIVVLPGGDCVASGEYDGTLDADGFTTASAGLTDGWIARFSGATGSVRWLRTLGGPLDDGINALAVHGGDHIAGGAELRSAAVLAGTEFVSDGGDEVVVFGLSPTGELEWATQLGGTGDVTLSNGGMTSDATDRWVAVGVAFTGELRVDDQMIIGSVAGDGAAIVLPIPR